MITFERTFFLVVIISLIGLISFNSFHNNETDTRTQIDSIAVTKIIQGTKEKQFETRFRPVVINNYISDSKHYKKVMDDLKNKYNVNADSLTILKELLEISKIRKHKEVFEDSLMIATVEAETKGYLKKVDFSYKLKPRSFRTYETTITRKIHSKNLLLGVDANTNFNKFSMDLNLMYQTKKGNAFRIGYGTDKTISVGYYQIIFRK